VYNKSVFVITVGSFAANSDYKKPPPRGEETMAAEDFRAEARALLERLIGETHTRKDEIPLLLDTYADELTRIYGQHAHFMLNELIEDARTRLDARLSPDPVRQTIASVQTTVQDLWKTIWGP
jgi:hypothetical protein